MQQFDRVETVVTEEQAAEPPSTLRAAECAPSDVSTNTVGVAHPPACGKELQHTSKTAQWNDWRWQVRNRVRSLDQLAAYVPSLSGRGELQKVIEKYPMAITPYYATLIGRADLSDPVFRMSVPSVQELCDPSSLSEDPLEEHEDMPVPGLVHR